MRTPDLTMPPVGSTLDRAVGALRSEMRYVVARLSYPCDVADLGTVRARLHDAAACVQAAWVAVPGDRSETSDADARLAMSDARALMVAVANLTSNLPTT